jgi:hypothetical protein
MYRRIGDALFILSILAAVTLAAYRTSIIFDASVCWGSC